MNTKKENKEDQNQEFDFRTIKSFEDACAKEGIDPTKLPDVSMIPEDFRKPIISQYKKQIVFKAINNGWVPDWNNYDQPKYFPWFKVLSSGFGFSHSHYGYDSTNSHCGSRLCCSSSEKALYIAERFEQLYIDDFLYPEK